MAQIDSEIEKMPMGYETLVGDMGSVLSGGQLQRVLLARALYPDPKALILDEGTANLDAENEAKILEVLRALSITRIAVAHRPATLLAAQRVVAVDAGSLRAMPKEPPMGAAGPKPVMFAPPLGSGPERASVMSIVRPAVAASSNSTDQPGASSAPPPLDHTNKGAEDLQREE
jgi:energy-coupling factor transporter ATP-binding protein EcfA2